jgi:hypothetical protein
MRNVAITLALCAVLLGGCVLAEDYHWYRIRRQQADILELYTACLKRKDADPRVDCSEYRRAVDVELRVRPE